MDLKRYFFQSKTFVFLILLKNNSIFDIGLQKFFLLSGFQIEIRFHVGLRFFSFNETESYDLKKCGVILDLSLCIWRFSFSRI